ncbi:unnamed protein product [Vitrella brassicaformis CCMP3155]|uniref:F-box domain-containing protein n=2 Tax=Vitrella brassicaformis TaxID=1169539 RepID=A0A0G4EKK4_VITBC|nr:unnamed protein product [Vitrella brassicaformis CCMP3155]|eukprot:CEL96953.1 unnamed protein product [Vitrella brassicaformis CCMP3155]
MTNQQERGESAASDEAVSGATDSPSGPRDNAVREPPVCSNEYENKLEAHRLLDLHFDQLLASLLDDESLRTVMKEGLHRALREDRVRAADVFGAARRALGGDKDGSDDDVAEEGRISVLPVPVVRHVMTFLSVKDILGRAACVCRAFERHSRATECYQALHLDDALTKSMSRARISFDRFRSTEKATISLARVPPLQGRRQTALKKLLSSLPGLRHLVLMKLKTRHAIDLLSTLHKTPATAQSLRTLKVSFYSRPGMPAKTVTDSHSWPHIGRLEELDMSMIPPSLNLAPVATGVRGVRENGLARVKLNFAAQPLQGLVEHVAQVVWETSRATLVQLHIGGSIDKGVLQYVLHQLYSSPSARLLSLDATELTLTNMTAVLTPPPPIPPYDNAVQRPPLGCRLTAVAILLLSRRHLLFLLQPFICVAPAAATGAGGEVPVVTVYFPAGLESHRRLAEAVGRAMERIRGERQGGLAETAHVSSDDRDTSQSKQVGRFSLGGWLWGLRRQCRLQWNLMTGSKAVVFL